MARGLIQLVAALAAGCGSVSGSKVDAPPAADDVAPPNPDAAWTNNAVWTAAGGLPETACAPWTLEETADTETPTIVDGHMTLATSVGAEDMFYRQDAAVIQPPTTTLVIETRVRFVSGDSNVNDRSALSVGIRMGGKANTFRIIDGMIYLLADSTTRGPTYTTTTSDMFHDYRIEMHLATGAIAVTRDGAQVLSGMAYADTRPDVINFGDTTGSAYGITEWLRVSHNAHVLAPCP